MDIVDDKYVTRRTTKASTVGDLRVAFQVTPADSVSIVAKPVDGQLAAFRTKNGESIALLEEGVVDANEMFARAQSNVTMMTWAFRVVGFVLALIGFYILLQPAVDLAHLFVGVPLFGPLVVTLVSWSVDILSFLLALSTSLVVIAISWVFHRPLVAFGLLVIAITPYFFVPVTKKPKTSLKSLE
ncbi:Aste57867_5784 [Aphanomyces stellatus]|nr:hypothetical protein As57867_005770 [Aphanomyces stellatus]VFT82807.1 Aste57867_5784 [Aphanomyces stellatus]